MNSKTLSFPEIEKIDPIPTPGTFRIGYVVVAKDGHYFNAKHKQAVERTLRSRLAKVTKMRPHSGTTLGKVRLAVNVEPSDSLAGLGSFVVHDTLQELFRPAVPYVAITAMQSPRQARGTFSIGMQVLGNPDSNIVNELEERIRTLPATVAVKHDAEGPRHFIITVVGSWDEVTQGYREALIARWHLIYHAPKQQVLGAGCKGGLSGRLFLRSPEGAHELSFMRSFWRFFIWSHITAYGTSYGYFVAIECNHQYVRKLAVISISPNARELYLYE